MTRVAKIRPSYFSDLSIPDWLRRDTLEFIIHNTWPYHDINDNGHICCAPLHEECLKHNGHKGDPGVTPGICGTVGENAQVILIWVMAPGVGSASYPRRLGVTRVRAWVIHSLWCADSRMLKNTSIRVVSTEIWQFEWGSSGLGVAPGTAKVWTDITSSILAQMGQVRSPPASTWNVDDTGLVVWEHARSYKEFMMFWSC